MKKALKTLALAAATTLAMSGNASAVLQTYGGVTFDPNNSLDFSMFPLIVHQEIYDTGIVDSDTGKNYQGYKGWGRVTGINGTTEATFCPTCELSFYFEGFLENVGGNIGTTTVGSINVRGGTLSFYRDDFGGGFTSLGTDAGVAATFSQARATDGTLWLALAGVKIATGVGTTDFPGGPDITGTITQTYGNSTDPLLPSSFGGTFYLEVTGGLADVMTQIDTDSAFQAANGNNADLLFQPANVTAGFVGPVGAGQECRQPVGLTNGLASANCYKEFNGSGTFGGDAKNNVPEPTTALLAGLGLLGLAGMRRRKQA